MTLPRIIEVETLQQHLTDNNLLIVDLSPREHYLQGHIPGAIHVETAQLIRGGKPAPGLLPDEPALSRLFSAIGLEQQTHVVCYDNEGGPWAGRFIWTLESLGHQHYSFVNGGIHAWKMAGLPLETTDNTPHPSSFTARIRPDFILTREQILDALQAPHSQLLVWDARSREEYEGTKVFAAKGGHIPGAIHLEWTELLDSDNGYRLKPNLRELLEAQGLRPDKPIVTHCQTHRRSGLTWFVARALDYPDIRAYPGSWSEWGNDPDTPVEQGPS